MLQAHADGGEDHLHGRYRRQLRYHQERTLHGGSSTEELGGWEEYRYDPLGRRVMVRRNAEGLCKDASAVQCASHVTRFVWSGDNRLWELKAAGGNTANLEAESSTGVLYGAVSYFHAGGIDRPLLISKSGVQIVPHQNWRGVFSAGTYGSGSLVGKKSDCMVFPPQNCTPVDWPGVHTTAWHQRTTGEIRNWFGSLATGMRDASGQTYMRNRYYDPATGQFTQPDPIGLAGGLNSYGFAAGDPVSYHDPYGLSGCSIFRPWECRIASITGGLSWSPGARARGRLGPVRVEAGVSGGAATTVTLMGDMSTKASTDAGAGGSAVVEVGSRTAGPEGSCSLRGGCSGAIGTGGENDALSGSGGSVGGQITLGFVTVGAEVDVKETAIAVAGGVVLGVEAIAGTFKSLFSFTDPRPTQSVVERTRDPDQ